ncbi:MAG: formate dehydrogenase subunit alpha [Nitrospirales bacterium]|nr:MAG: formate dehydrogenase subunit alpha [Nitrospirales bacterium]
MSEQTATDMVTVTIDDHTTTVPKGTLVIEAARQVGVMIPHFCYHPKLTPDANCRMCLVEIEKMPRLQTSCSTPVSDGMVVRSSASSTVKQARKSVLDFILANHPLDCPVCDQGGRCDLQDFSHEYTASGTKFVELKRVFQKEYFSPVIETQMNRCVQCLRCVRYCDQVMDVRALAPAGRGTMTKIQSFGVHELDCEFCGGCVQICPVGAITSRLSMYEFRPWMLKRTESICGYCGDGCQMTFQAKNDDLIEVNSTHGAGRNNGDLCSRGYFGYHANVHEDRLKAPLVRRDGVFVEVTWEEALEVVAEQLMRIKTESGPDSIGGLIASRCTNEDLYLFQKFMRVVIGTNNLDSSARFGHVNGIHALRQVQGTHSWTVSYEDILAANAVLLVGTNITETNPITALKVKEAVKRRGTDLITLEALRPTIGTISNITLLSTHHLPVSPDQFGAGVIGLLKAVIEAELVDADLSAKAKDYVLNIKERVGAISWSDIEAQTGLMSSGFNDAATAFSKAERAVVLVGQGVLRSQGGFGITLNLLDLLVLTGKLSRPGCGLGPLAEENNDQGSVEMGAIAEWLPGALDVASEDARQTLETTWGCALPANAGLSLMDMLDGAKSGQLKAMMVIGENPVASLPPTSGVKDALENLEFLMCQELFLTETAKLADVVLPACSYAEKDGTFTNTEGHTQAVRKAIDPLGDSRPDWEILSALSALMDNPLEYEGVKAVGKEMRNVIPGTRTLGPSPSPPEPSSETMTHYLQEGYRKSLATRYQLSDRIDKATFVLNVGQSLFHSGKFSTRAKGLLRIQDQGILNMNPEDAERLGIECGSRVRVSNAQGQVDTTVKLLDRLPTGVLFFPEHFDEDIRTLLSVSVDGETKVPCYKCTSVIVEKVS